MTRNRTFMIAAIAAVVAIIVLFNTVYVVGQTEQAIVLNLGDPVRVVHAPATDDPPGLKVKVPFVETVVKFDNRNLQFELPEQEIVGSDQNRLVVDAFVRYRINDPLQFYRVLRSQDLAENQLHSMITSALREQMGSVTIEEIISSRRAALMTETRDEVARRAKAARFGIQVIDLRIKRADYPKANETAVFDRMKTARQQLAAQYRAKGQQQRLEIMGAATKQGEQIRGEADASRAKIFAESFGQDPSFAAFYRSMSAYEASMGQGDTTMVLSPDSEFFKYFSGGPGK
jgi:membrane protease subunit HflC